MNSLNQTQKKEHFFVLSKIEIKNALQGSTPYSR
jgi:hypothetical protein